MTLSVRRVVTGHDAQHRALVTADEWVAASAARPGQEACVLWATERVPEDNLDPRDGAAKAAASTLADGAVFRVVRYAAGMVGRMHRTRSTDYAVILSGAIVLQLDGGAEVSLQAGDVLIQRGTAHNWINHGPEACTIAFVLVDALPIQDAAAEPPPS